MTARQPQQPAANEYSGRITRQLILRAEEAFGPTLADDQLDSLLNEVLEDPEQLEETERRQLQEIAQLAAAKDGEVEGDSPFRCAGSFELTPSADEMFMALTVRPPVAGGVATKVEQVLAALKDKGINRGADLKAIRRCTAQAEQGEEVHEVVVVSGRAPTPGHDASLQRLARLSNDSPPEPVTQRHLEGEQFLLCRRGDVVMRYVPPRPGEPGHTALGRTLDPPEPADIQPQAGKNIRREGNDFIAEVAGVVLFENDKVEARKALLINQDVTHKSEPIDFDGEVQIRAAVRTGATIRATGNITIEGPVEAAEIESTGGDIVLRSGVAGRNVAVIRAARDVNARFTEGASLFAGRDISLQMGSLHSRLIAYHQINANQGKGHLAGGIVMAGEKIAVKQLGARGGVRTDVTVGISGDVLKALSQIDQLTARATQRRDNAVDLLEQILRAVGDPRKLSEKELGVYTKLRQLQLVCDVQIRKLNQRRRQVLAEGVRDHGGKIEVYTNIMSNVHVTIGADDTEPEGQHGPCTLLFDEQSQKVVVRPGI